MQEILQRIFVYWIIPEQFTVKAHPALFEGEGKGRGKKVRNNTFIPVYIHIQTAKARTLCVYGASNVPIMQGLDVRWHSL